MHQIFVAHELVTSTSKAEVLHAMHVLALSSITASIELLNTPLIYTNIFILALAWLE